MFRQTASALAVLLLLLGGSAAASEVDEYSEDLRVHFIDVGQGDCIFVITPNDTIPGNGKREGYRVLIDAGKNGRSEGVIIPYLEGLGMGAGDRIDYVIATHAHEDHIGGMPEIFETYQVDAVVDPGYCHTSATYDRFEIAAHDEAGCTCYFDPVECGLVECNGDCFDLGGEMEARVLYTCPDGRGRIHDANIVLRLVYGDVSFLLMGDAEGKSGYEPDDPIAHIEEYLVENYEPEELQSTVLKVGHHGSETSTSAEFLEVVQPEYAVILSGRQRYHGAYLPRPTVVERLEAVVEEVWRTDEGDGHLTSDTDAAGDDSFVFVTDGTNVYPNPRP